jgi:hypothetical protein
LRHNKTLVLDDVYNLCVDSLWFGFGFGKAQALHKDFDGADGAVTSIGRPDDI